MKIISQRANAVLQFLIGNLVNKVLPGCTIGQFAFKDLTSEEKQQPKYNMASQSHYLLVQMT